MLGVGRDSRIDDQISSDTADEMDGSIGITGRAKLRDIELGLEQPAYGQQDETAKWDGFHRISDPA